jgi:hypothetical protein
MYYTCDNDEDILRKLIERIDYMISHHNKVLIVRLDARYPVAYLSDGGNGEISLLLKSLMEICNYMGIECHYVWVREKDSGGSNHHYHVVMMLDGSRIQNADDLLRRADTTWSNLFGGGFENRIHFCEQVRDGKKVPGGVMIRRPSSTATGQEKINQEREFQAQRTEAVYMASYLAKNVTKEDQLPYRVRRYGSSEL